MRTREIFSAAARARCAQTDEPIQAVDPRTGIALIYRFEEARGGVLTAYGGPLHPDAITSRPAGLDALNAVATRLCDSLAGGRGMEP